MLFNSFNFFFLFFPIVTILYYLLPGKYRWIMLLAASCFFYMCFVPIYILILLITILIDYFAAIAIHRAQGKTKKMFLVVSIVSTCVVLLIFKYFNFVNDNLRFVANSFHWNYSIPMLKLLLPIGLSFHTFQSLSYVIEVYRGNQKPEPHFGIYSLYVMFYPQLVAGPIERPQNMLHQFHEHHNFSYDNVTQGLKRMMWGFFKKIVIADRAAIYVNAVFNNYQHHNGTSLALGVLLFAFQVYCDFSGYSDIALGSAQVMGFTLMTNFNRPYFSKNLTEFWRRWHISLSSWFNDYLFSPLVVAYRDWGKFGVVLALMITFCVSGLWHGAGWTFIVFGLFHGAALVYDFLSKKFRKKLSKNTPAFIYNGLSIILSFAFLNFTLVFFRSGSFAQALTIYQKIFTQPGKLYWGDYKAIVYSAFFIFILVTIEIFEEYGLFNNFSLYRNNSWLVRRLTYCLLVVVIILFGVFDGSQFIYFQF